MSGFGAADSTSVCLPTPSGEAIGPLAGCNLAALLALDSAAFAQSERWSVESWESELENAEVTGLFSAGRLAAVSSFSVMGESADLRRIETHPDARRHGFAVKLLEAGFAECKARGAERVLLEVDEFNEPALALYAKLGFSEIARRERYYKNGHAAVVMEKCL
ncbi:MAG: GNAT family N-acetyltransferase [Propionibacteriaceae bacterium]|jgi:ribosomal-protein-alanine N-acetyltransferase|nr:GNAT family N-acetyltransferase [Propionibacteriaceae bacterium]